jgi:hypothetical protein
VVVAVVVVLLLLAPWSSPSIAGQAGSLRETVSSQSALKARERVGFAPGLTEKRRVPQVPFTCGERIGGVLSFGYFSLHKQRKVTRPRGANRKLI